MISVLTVTYHSEKVLPGFLSSLEKIRPLIEEPIEILVHDNTFANIGLSKAVNLLLRKAQGSRVLICNPDILFNKSVLSLIHASNEFPDAMLVPILLSPNGVEQRVIYRRLPTVARIFSDMTTFGRMISRIFPSIHRDYCYAAKRVGNPEQVGTVCLLSSKTTIDKLSLKEGLYNERFPVFWNDVDLCERAKRLGVKIRLISSAAIPHQLSHSSGSANKEMLMMLFFSHQGMIGYARTWNHHPNILRTMLFLDTIFSISIKFFARLRRKKRSAQGERVAGLTTAARGWVLRFRCSLL